MSGEVPIDVDVLKSEIKKTYADVSARPATEFIFPTGRAWALDLGYPPDLLARVPDGSAESFAGVANPFSLGGLATNVDFGESEVEQLPFEDGSFDVVISNGVIDLIPDKDLVFAELYRVLRPGGRLQIADVTLQNPVSEASGTSTSGLAE
jgi:arsenite methyltransferase